MTGKPWYSIFWSRRRHTQWEEQQRLHTEAEALQEKRVMDLIAATLRPSYPTRTSPVPRVTPRHPAQGKVSSSYPIDEDARRLRDADTTNTLLTAAIVYAAVSSSSSSGCSSSSSYDSGGSCSLD